MKAAQHEAEKAKTPQGKLWAAAALIAVALLAAAAFRWQAQYWWALKSLNDYGSAVSALATVFVAAFTLTLWRATDQLWLAGEKTLNVTQRAFVYLEGFATELTLLDDVPSNREFALQPGKDRSLWVTRFAVQPRWTNSGTTPARNMVTETHWTLHPGDLPQDFPYDYLGVVKPLFIGPKAIVSGETFELSRSNEAISNGMEGGPSLYIWGRAGYDDVFGKRHFVHWCYRVRFHRFDGGRLKADYIQYGDYNDSD